MTWQTQLMETKCYQDKSLNLFTETLLILIYLSFSSLIWVCVVGYEQNVITIVVCSLNPFVGA